MKEIKAFIKPKRVQKVIESLSEGGFKSMTLSQGEGTGAFKAKGASPSLDFRVTDSPGDIENAFQIKTGKSLKISDLNKDENE